MASLNMQKNLTYVGRGYYIAKGDPRYWHKMLHFKPDDPEAMYYVGLDYESEGKRNYFLYQQTKHSSYLKTYESCLEKALHFTRKASLTGYLRARADAIRIGDELNNLIKIPSIPSITNGSSKSSTSQYLTLTLIIFLASIIIGGGIYYFLIQKNEPFNKQTSVNNNFASMIPYLVKNEKPEDLPEISYRETTIYIDPLRSLPLTDALVNTLKEQYKIDQKTPIKIRALDTGGGTEKGLAVWNGPNSNIKVYIYPDDQIDQMLFESTTVIRSALYQFAKENGYFPPKLEDLTKPLPNNYLSSIPEGPQSPSKPETSFTDGTRGWVYNPGKSIKPSSSELISQIEQVLKPNLKDLKPIPFEPLEIEIDKTTNTLTLKSGDKPLRSYPVALGKNNLTPEGEFNIHKKIANPNKNTPNSVFGTRALELSNEAYSIHGTNDPSSIGQNISNGCIRLNNPDIEELYSMTPLHTPVKITKNYKKDTSSSLVSSKVQNSYLSKITNPYEEDNSTYYYWNK